MSRSCGSSSIGASSVESSSVATSAEFSSCVSVGQDKDDDDMLNEDVGASSSSSSQPGGMAASSSDSSCADDTSTVSTSPPFRGTDPAGRSCLSGRNAASWLYARERGLFSHYGGRSCKGKRLRSSPGPCGEDRLASVVAWNPSRFHNMILAVGPGTPAAAAAYHQAGGRHSIATSSEDEDEEEEEAMMAASSEDDDNAVEAEFENVEGSTQESIDVNEDSSRNTTTNTENASPAETSPPTLAGRASSEVSAAIVTPSSDDAAKASDSSAEKAAPKMPESYDAADGDPKLNVSTASEDPDDEDEGPTGETPAASSVASFDMDDDDDDEPGGRASADAETRREDAIRYLLRSGHMQLPRQDSEDDDDDDGEDEEEAERERIAIRRIRRRTIRSPLRNNNSAGTATRNRSNPGQPSIRHGGCINTACWLECPWRLSTVKEEYGELRSLNSGSVSIVESYECPTQLVTSGDDRLVKFWDVSGAMGMDTPLHGGWNTYCPLSTTNLPPTVSTIRSKWSRYYSERSNLTPSGTVYNLATLSTAHRGNVFHVTPIPQLPGKILTCGADGYLRLSDLQHAGSQASPTSSSSVIVHPYIEDDETLGANSPFVIHSGMAYSHTLLTSHTGLLCSDRGLHHFDLRLPARQQSKHSLLQGRDEGSSSWRSGLCKACAIWYPHGRPRATISTSASAEVAATSMESHYVFAGGASETVGLYDLRMDGSRSKLVERYKPHWLASSDAELDSHYHSRSRVSVSGLDVSRDGRELLVSYESDQIYAFSILEGSNAEKKSSRCFGGAPTVEEMDAVGKLYQDDEELFQSELASFGAHLNRFTFLKNARYAGPNDEYICTGSDSGHAWLYHRSTGTVASLLGADSSTCNGVIPHPSLPFFCTYGIDTTAKLWRATPPVDPAADDSKEGRYHCSLGQPYEPSPVTARTWEGVRVMLHFFDAVTPELANCSSVILPDLIASSEEIAASGRFSSPCRRGILGTSSNNDIEAPRLGNALAALPCMLRQNQYECYRALVEELDVPIEHPLVGLTQRVTTCRLYTQAARLGLQNYWQPWRPWATGETAAASTSSNGVSSPIGHVHPADLVPDFPSDWILYDSRMLREKQTGKKSKKRRNPALEPRAPYQKSFYKSGLIESHFPDFFLGQPTQDNAPAVTPPWLVGRLALLNDGALANPDSISDEKMSTDGESSKIAEDQQARSVFSREMLYETVKLLKEGGNQAINSGMLHAAARRYDKAIQYCAIAFLHCNNPNVEHLRQGFGEGDVPIRVPSGPSGRPSPCIVEWSPLLELLVSSRLNMALLLLKPEFQQSDRAAGHARAAIDILKPFTMKQGHIIVERNNGASSSATGDSDHHGNIIVSASEPASTYDKAVSFTAKAMFRLGSAELQTGDYSAAVKSFEASMAYNDDPLTLRRLQESRRRYKAQKKRERAKFQKLLWTNKNKSKAESDDDDQQADEDQEMETNDSDAEDAEEEET